MPSLSYSQATLRISFSAKLCASSRRSFCSSVRVKSTTGDAPFVVAFKLCVGAPKAGVRRLTGQSTNGKVSGWTLCLGTRDGAFRGDEGGGVLIFTGVVAPLIGFGLTAADRRLGLLGGGTFAILHDSRPRRPPAGDRPGDPGGRGAPDAGGESAPPEERGEPALDVEAESARLLRRPRGRSDGMTRSCGPRSASWSSPATNGAARRAWSRSTSRPRPNASWPSWRRIAARWPPSRGEPLRGRGAADPARDLLQPADRGRRHRRRLRLDRPGGLQHGGLRGRRLGPHLRRGPGRRGRPRPRPRDLPDPLPPRLRPAPSPRPRSNRATRSSTRTRTARTPAARTRLRPARATGRCRQSGRARRSRWPCRRAGESPGAAR